MNESVSKSVIIPSYALSRERRLRREAARKTQVQTEKHQLQLEIVSDPEDAEYRIKDRYWAERIGGELVKRYPGRGWVVEVDIRNGIAKIYNAHVSGKFGWILKLKDIRESSFSADMRKIGGEMLERANLSRGEFIASEVIDLQRNIAGHARFDIS